MTTRTGGARQGGVQMENKTEQHKNLIQTAHEIRDNYGGVLEQWKESGTPYQKAMAAVVDEVLQSEEASA